MKKSGKHFISGAIIAVAALLIAVCFAVSIATVEKFAKEDCFDSIEEATAQVNDMFCHTLEQHREHLTLFSNVLAANASTSETLLETYMKNFCDTQSFSAVCIHTWDGRSASYGDCHPHQEFADASFAEEAEKAPYVSGVIRLGDSRSQRYICLAVPSLREGEVRAILYGYIPLDVLPDFFSSTAYDGKCEFYLVEGGTGDFMMDEYHRYGEDGEELPLLNLHDGSMGEREAMPGYRTEDMIEGIVKGGTGYHVFRSRRTGLWYYTYYMPTGINDWSMQLTLDEPTAFASYYGLRTKVFALMACVLILALVIVAVVLCRGVRRRRQDRAELHRADYRSAVQGALITAHNHPDFVDRALKLVAREMEAETALLLTFSNKEISSVYYWPSEDQSRATALVGRNVQKTFPVLLDALASNESIYCSQQDIETRLSPEARKIMKGYDIRNILLVPVADNAGVLKGAIAAVNMKGKAVSPDALEMVSGDFFMAISNLESNNIIRQMGAIDYLTGVKNRNSFETESPGFETLRASSLWCMYVDVNGLHDMNNTRGHTAGDTLLCAVALSVRRIFGPDMTYRMGGDEFVAFRTNSNHEEFMSFKYRLMDELAKMDYSVSAGFQGICKNEKGIFEVARLMTEAEAIMYREKRAYYEQTGHPEERKGPSQDVCDPEGAAQPRTEEKAP